MKRVSYVDGERSRILGFLSDASPFRGEIRANVEYLHGPENAAKNARLRDDNVFVSFWNAKKQKNLPESDDREVVRRADGDIHCVERERGKFLPSD